MRYKAVVARTYLCVCALLEMIIHSALDRGPDQIEIAQYLGVFLPFQHQDKAVSNFHLTDDPNKWGVVVRDDAINRFFLEYSIPLKENFFSINLFEDWSFEDKIKSLLDTGAHVICGLAADALDNVQSDAALLQCGHVVAIIDLTPSEGLDRDVVLYDPGPLTPGLRRMPAWRLFAAIKARSDGIWAITHT